MAVAEDELYPPYIRRDESRDILAAVERVRQSGNSQAVLLYGNGGVGKTTFVRALADEGTADQSVAWLRPIDLDDQEFWLLPTLQEHVARQLDHDGAYFGRYLEYVAQPPVPQEKVTTELAFSRLEYGRRIFLECYGGYVGETGKTVVMTFDTVEAVRGVPLLMALTQWMKSLPATLFILSGRPVSHGDAGDPIAVELTDPHRPLEVTQVRLAEFSKAAADGYLIASRVADGLTSDEIENIVLLTRGHPLWLALAVAYVDAHGVPQEADTKLRRAIAQDVPYRGDLTVSGKRRQEDFKRRLLSPYRNADFWHEAVNRLAAVRQSVNEPMWRALMGDRGLPADIDPSEAWQRLVRTPWIRSRASGTAVTLHDAMAEELARRVLPMHDQSQEWRKGLWRRMIANCDDQLAVLVSRYEADTDKLQSRRRLSGEYEPLAREAARLEREKRKIEQLKIQRFHYQLLSDFEAGCRYLLDLFAEAGQRQDLLFQDLLATAMRRYLTAGEIPGAVDDADSDVIREFRDWLVAGHQDLYREIGIALADFLVHSGQATAAIEVLAELPLSGASPHQVSRHRLLLGGAYLRVPREVRQGLYYLEEARLVAEDPVLTPEESNRLAAAAYNSLGLYYRNVGRWQDADTAYQHARDAILAVVIGSRSAEDRAQLASIQNNWGYVKGLGGFYRDGLSLVSSALKVRAQFGLRRELGMSYSTQGEVYRYQQQFQAAWESYAKAVRIFEDLEDSAWLGTIYQEQAICLFQAHQAGLGLLPPGRDQLAEARRLALQAVERCRERSVRNYPSALNRAGRVIGHTNADEGLRLLAEGIDASRELSDGWFRLANLIEHAELCYRTWAATGDARYRELIDQYEPELRTATSEYEFPPDGGLRAARGFPDLRGRWEILRAHLAVKDWAATDGEGLLDAALCDYRNGFLHIAERGHVGSSGTSVIPGAFEAFKELFSGLSECVQSQWLGVLQRAWSEPVPGSTMLLAELEKLY